MNTLPTSLLIAHLCAVGNLHPHSSATARPLPQPHLGSPPEKSISESPAGVFCIANLRKDVFAQSKLKTK